MTQDNNSLPPAAGATTGGSTASDIGGGRSAVSGSSSAFGDGSTYSDTSRPGTATAGGYQPSSGPQPEIRDYGGSAPRYGSEPGSYRTSHDNVTVQRSSRSQPSTAVVVGAALAGAITGAAIPFMFAGRKSADKGTIVVDERRDFDSDVADSSLSSSRTGSSAGRW